MKSIKANETESVCPVCLKVVPARREPRGDDMYLVKTCDEHGPFSTILWRGAPAMADWRRPKEPVRAGISYGLVDKGCPHDCGLCEEHRQVPCSVLIEVTERCNLQCAVCFADAGSKGAPDPTLERISWQLQRAVAAVGVTNLQLSGGEPTLRDDLPEIVALARGIGYSFIQLNSNGIRLSGDPAYAASLKAAGLSSVFLQFDGVDDAVYLTLRGKELLECKLRAIRHAGAAGLGVVLVPTLVQGVNTDAIGAIVRQALELAPIVRGVHFQPVSYFGRHPEANGDAVRFTLPELMRALEAQTDGLVKVADFTPPGCEHAHCSCHATYLYSGDGSLRALGGSGQGCCSVDSGAGGVGRTVDTMKRRWQLSGTPPYAGKAASTGSAACCCGSAERKPTRVEAPLDLDLFLSEAPTGTFTISSMAFQDAENLDLERLKGCCISVLAPDGMMVPFCAYNLTSREGKTLYRR